MPRHFRSILACLLLAGCATAPAGPEAVPGSRSGPPLEPLILAQVGDLTHEGGIVYGQSLDTLRDAASRAAASILQVELSLAMRADRTMRDAGALAGAPAHYAVLATGNNGSNGDSRDSNSGNGGNNGNNGKKPSAPPGQVGKAEASPKASPGHQGRPATTADAKAAWAAATPAERTAATAAHEAQAAAVRTALAPILAADAAAFARRGPDVEVPMEDGGKAVTTTFDVSGQDGPRAVEVQRTYDAAGDMVEQAVRLQGGTATQHVSAVRTWRYLPDGSADGDASITLALPGGDHVITWHPLAATGGVVSGSGQIARPDGAALPAGVEGPQGELTRIYATDAATGIKGEIQAELGATSGTLTIDAGPAGLVKLAVPVDAQAAR